MPALCAPDSLVCVHLRVRGTVQGVGFRPTVWRLASELGVAGSVINDAEGVLIVAIGQAEQIDALVRRVRDDAPPLARIEAIERVAQQLPDPIPTTFVIGASAGRMPRATEAAASANAAVTGVSGKEYCVGVPVMASIGGRPVHNRPFAKADQQRHQLKPQPRKDLGELRV